MTQPTTDHGEMPSRYTVRFYTLAGGFRVARTVILPYPEILPAVTAYAEAGGFSGVKAVAGEEPEELRFTARTPGGRHGRNIAFAEPVWGPWR